VYNSCSHLSLLFIGYGIRSSKGDGDIKSHVRYAYNATNNSYPIPLRDISTGLDPSVNQLWYADLYLSSYLSLQMIDHNLQKFYDKFGILEIYPTKHNGQEWYMNMTEPNHDPRFAWVYLMRLSLGEGQSRYLGGTMQGRRHKKF
jgi:hypothetical protein